MTNREKFSKLVSDEKTDTIERNRKRIKNRSMLRQSQQIALKVLLKLDELRWTQKDLATEMKVSPQQVNKIVKGKENLTLETQIKLQEILDIAILASYYEKKEENGEMIIRFKEEPLAYVPESNILSDDYIDSTSSPSIAKMNYDKALNEYTYEVAC